MSLYLSKPTYPASPVRSVSSLAKALRTNENFLRDLANRANSLWRTVRPKPGSSRQTFDAIGPLKQIHRLLKHTFFQKVNFPPYLQGSLKGCDYVSNAALHEGKQILICEDVKSFFPSVRAEFVEDVWCGFFGFSPEVSQLLTLLTTKDGQLPQGAITSSYLANLVMWRREPLLHAKLAEKGITYSRYVDDMCMSSKEYLDKETQTWVIAQIYGLLSSHGLRAGRKKHEIFSASKPMIATKLIVNQKPSLPKKKRSMIRAQVKHLEIAFEKNLPPDELRVLANKASNLVGQLGRFHQADANLLRKRIKKVRDSIPSDETPVVTGPTGFITDSVRQDPETPPWI